MYQLTLKLSHQQAFFAEEVLADIANAVTWFEEPGQQTASADVFAERWQLDAIFQQKPDFSVIKNLLKQHGVEYSSIRLEKLPQTDWLKKNQESFPPIRAGRFYVHPSDQRDTPPSVKPIMIDAATAFGTGHHATTYGCLLAVDRLSRIVKPKRVLDMGCGTAILAMGAARLFPWAQFLAVDIDSEAVCVSKINVRVNGLSRIPCEVSKGFRSSRVKRGARYDLILANILAKPLALMAGDMRNQAARGGYIILSGLLKGQERQVAAAYARHGFRFCGRIAQNGWHTLIYQA